MSPLLTSLERLLALTESMAEAAEAQEWEALVSLGEKRSQLSNTLPSNFNAQLPVSEKTAARTIIERYQGLDQRTRSLIEERQVSLRVLLRVPAP